MTAPAAPSKIMATCPSCGLLVHADPDHGSLVFAEHEAEAVAPESCFGSGQLVESAEIVSVA